MRFAAAGAGRFHKKGDDGVDGGTRALHNLLSSLADDPTPGSARDSFGALAEQCWAAKYGDPQEFSALDEKQVPF
jgi:hypothetical protein